jgi:hypothetical protein
MNEEVRKILSNPTAPIPEVGRVFFGLGRNASSEAAKRGDFETIQIGRLRKALTAPLKRLVGLDEG